MQQGRVEPPLIVGEAEPGDRQELLAKIESTAYSKEELDAQAAAACRRQLKAWGDALALHGLPESPAAQARRLSDFLGGELGFQGDLTDYYTGARGRRAGRRRS